jgi:hypothetical protein
LIVRDDLIEVDRAWPRTHFIKSLAFPRALTAVCPQTLVKCVQCGHPSTLGSFRGGMLRDL